MQPGDGADLSIEAGDADFARLTAQALFEEFGQTFIVDNRGGGGGMIGVEGAARATPDRYTLLFSSTGPVTISPVLFKNYCSSLPRVRRVRSKARVNLAFNGTKQDPSS